MQCSGACELVIPGTRKLDMRRITLAMMILVVSMAVALSMSLAGCGEDHHHDYYRDGGERREGHDRDRHEEHHDADRHDEDHRDG